MAANDTAEAIEEMELEIPEAHTWEDVARWLARSEIERKFDDLRSAVLPLGRKLGNDEPVTQEEVWHALNRLEDLRKILEQVERVDTVREE